MRFLKWKRRVAALSAALLASVGLAVVGPASPAGAVGPVCQNGGVLLVFARGSGAKLNPRSNEAVRFFTAVSSQLGSIPNALVQVGDEDEDGDSGDGWGGVDQEKSEYPAVAWNQWINADGSWGLDLSGYNTSRETGTNGLVSFLTQRNCPQEAIVLGGYSPGCGCRGCGLAAPA